jgi:hypothetical protein
LIREENPLENRDLALAAFALQKGYSLVLVKGGKLIAAKEGRGIRPLLELVEERGGELQGASLADKVVGRAAAFLAAYVGLAGIYTRIISKPALDVLRKYGIEVAFAHQVPAILNRQKTGLCPMETLSATFKEPGEAPGKIRERLQELQRLGTKTGWG